MSLHRFAIFVAIATIGLIYVGGLVTSTDSGLSVPDWPLSYGQVFPKMVGGVFYEHGHRMVAATVGMLTVILVVWMWYREPRRWVRRVAILALLAVVCQGVLGGITVLFLLPAAVSIGHAALAQLFLCLTVSLAVFTSRGWRERQPNLEDNGAPRLRVLTTVTTAAIYGQILLGALVRHTGSGLAIPDFPLAFGRLVPEVFTRQILIQYLHRIGAVVVLACVVWTVSAVMRRYGANRWLVRPAILLSAALFTQILLGAETVWSGKAVLPATLHVAVGAITLAASVILALRTYRVLYPRALPGTVTLVDADA
jgi:cytochrome c oxidase assembly protein subunit 15